MSIPALKAIIRGETPLAYKLAGNQRQEIASALNFLSGPNDEMRSSILFGVDAEFFQTVLKGGAGQSDQLRRALGPPRLYPWFVAAPSRCDAAPPLSAIRRNLAGGKRVRQIDRSICQYPSAGWFARAIESRCA